MGSSSAGPGGFTGGGPASSGTGHGGSASSGTGHGGSASSGTGHGGTGHGSGHASSSTSAHGTAVAHNATVAASKNSATRNQALRNSFTSDTKLERSSDRIRSRQITSTGGFTPETDRKKKLKTNNALATKNATQNSAAH